ncbi:MAG TPA: hypothetical protein VLM37_02830 [Fibrobacteraceae bacterium]|nr:hypothetical protein [Fibrobacteraceae bacterium]
MQQRELRTMALSLFLAVVSGCDNTSDSAEKMYVETTITLKFDRLIYAFDNVAVQLRTTSETLGSYTVVYTQDLDADTSVTFVTLLPESFGEHVTAGMYFNKGAFSAENDYGFYLSGGAHANVSIALKQSMTVCKAAQETWGGGYAPSCTYKTIADSADYWPSETIDSMGIEGTWIRVSSSDTTMSLTIDSLGGFVATYGGSYKTADAIVGFLSIEDSTTLRYWPVAYNMGGSMITSSMSSELWGIVRDSTTGAVLSIGGATSAE